MCRKRVFLLCIGAGFQVLTLIAGLEFIAIVAMQQMFAGSGRLPGDFGTYMHNIYTH